jgi:hypothetical protein
VRKVLIVLAILYTVILSLNYIIGASQTPPGYLFLGTVHHPNDYFYYLSQFTQGQKHWVFSVDLFTSEKLQPTLIGLSNVLAGHILSLFKITPILAYEITLTLYTFLFFLLSMFFLEQVFPKEKDAQLIAFILLGIANIVPGSGSFFINVAEPMVRYPRVPHQMLGLVCIILPMILISKWQSKNHSLHNKIIQVVLTIVASVFLANINPVQWILICCVLFSSIFLFNSTIYGLRFTNYEKKSFLLPSIFFFSGLPMIFYIMHVFKTLPYTQVATWESWQQIRLSFVDFLQSFGPVFILAVLGLPLFFKKITRARMLILIYTAASIILFLSPISQYAHITNVRFLSAITVLGESILAAYFIVCIPIGNRIAHRIIISAIVLALSVYLIPLYITQFQIHANLDVNNSYTYFSEDTNAAYLAVRKLTRVNDLVLSTWPYDPSMPALTGRRGFMGHPLLTINSDAKIQDAYHFFDAQENDEAMHKFLTDNGITYVLEFTGVTKIIKPFLHVVYQNPTLTLYKVLL